MKSESLITQSWLCLLIRIIATKSYANPSTKLAVMQNFPSKSKSRAPYHIGESFTGENFCYLVEKWNFAEKTFVDCSLVPRLSLQTITEKIITDRRKTAKFAKVFSLESFLHAIQYYVLCDLASVILEQY